jgi:hypothetical protein
VVVAQCAVFGQAVLAAETSVSGFATVGYALSDRPYAYQRFIDNSGSFKRDSVFGIQVDTRLTSEVSVTLQGKLAASADSDQGVQAALSWGFVSWRPNNELLLRLGKFRAPLYLNSETSDVGVTFPLARPPSEVYSQSPTDDFRGASASYTWTLGDGDLMLDGYWGRAGTNLRAWLRNGLPGEWAQGANYLPVSVEIAGLAATWRRGDDTFRLGYARGRVDSRTPQLFYVRYPFVPIPGLPGVGFYLPVSDPQLGEVPITSRLTIPVLTLGADISTSSGIRVMAEVGRRIVKDTDLGYDTTGAYLALLRPSGRWTPYVSVAILRSSGRNLSVYRAVSRNRVPDFVPDAALINALQIAAADAAPNFDQRSAAIGTSYALSPKQFLKAEIQGVRVGEVSGLVDAPPSDNVQRSNITLLSLSFNMVF